MTFPCHIRLVILCMVGLKYVILTFSGRIRLVILCMVGLKYVILAFPGHILLVKLYMDVLQYVIVSFPGRPHLFCSAHDKGRMFLFLFVLVSLPLGW